MNTIDTKKIWYPDTMRFHFNVDELNTIKDIQLVEKIRGLLNFVEEMVASNNNLLKENK